MSEEKKMPERSITVVLKGQSYSVNFPTNGQLIDIEVLRAKLSDGKYNQILNSGRTSGLYSTIVIDTISTISILLPKFKETLSVPISELSPLDTREFVEVYMKQIQPWIEEWLTILTDIKFD